MERPRYWSGIDLASETFTSSGLTQPGELVLGEQIPNTSEGVAQWVSALQTHQITPDNAVVVMEATGISGEQVGYSLRAKGYTVAVEPPNEVKKAFNSNRKNDTGDSQQSAEYGYRFFDKLHFWEPKADLLEQIRTLLTPREQFTTHLTATKNTLHALGRKVVQTPLATQMLHQQIHHLQHSIKEIDQAIKELIDQDPSLKQMRLLLKSIPGVGLLLSAHLMVITCGFTQHVNPKSLAAYLGICPYEHQSGSSVDKKPTSDRHGTGKLRKLVYLASMSVRTHNAQFRAYFHRKVAQGKSEKLVLNNIATRVLRIICAIVQSGVPFNAEYRAVNPILLK